MAGEASRENGKKGGRPISEATIRAQVARDYISTEMERGLKSIVAKAIAQAKAGDKYAREWLSDQGWGKVPQQLQHSGELTLTDEEARQKGNAAIAAVLPTGDTE